VDRGGSDGPAKDRFIPLPAQNLNNTQNQWAIGLPNDTYQVTILSGDPQVSSGAHYQTYANGVKVPAGWPSSGSGPGFPGIPPSPSAMDGFACMAGQMPKAM